MSNRQRKLWLAVFFGLCLGWFVNRGPYRAIRYSTTGDFSTVYAAARCWLHGSNPYLSASLKQELAAAGAPADIQHDQDINPSVYLPAAFPWVSIVAWLPWVPANTLWCLLLLASFAFSLWKILENTAPYRQAKWLIVCAALLFSPTYVGIYDGNPGVLAISLVVLAICYAARARATSAGVLFGVACCFKPQIALCALCVLAVWHSWKSILIGAAVSALAMLFGMAVVSGFGHNWQWWGSEQQNIAVSFQPGGQSDPSPQSKVAWQLLNAQTLASYVIHDRHAVDFAVWLFSALLLAVWWFRRPRPGRPRWLDAGFFAALTLLLTYHRYYDAQLLLLTIPLSIELWRKEQRWAGSVLLACLFILAIPLESIFARRLGAAATSASFTQFVLLRNQPAAVLAMAITLAFCCRKPVETEIAKPRAS